MRHRRARRLLGVGLGVVFSAIVLTARAAWGQGCQTPRPFTDEEASFLSERTRVLKSLVPGAPSGWTRSDVSSAVSGGPLCDDPGYKPPLFVRVAAEYLPAGAPELSADQRRAEYDAWQANVDAATRESNAAAQAGDRARIVRAKKALSDLTSHPVPAPSINPLKSRRRVDLRLQVNATSFPLCGRSAPIDVNGATFALRATATTCRSRTAGDVYSVAFGGWKTKPNTSGAYLAAFNEWPAPPLPRAKVHTVLAETFGDAEALDEVARGLDLSKLREMLDH